MCNAEAERRRLTQSAVLTSASETGTWCREDFDTRARIRLSSYLVAAAEHVREHCETTGAAPKYSQWGAPQNLGCTVNSPFDEAGPAISKDGLSLFFGSNRPDGGFGNFDLYVSQRASIADPWGEPVNLGPVINSDKIENIPSLSRIDIYVTTRVRVTGHESID